MKIDIYLDPLMWHTYEYSLHIAGWIPYLVTRTFVPSRDWKVPRVLVIRNRVLRTLKRRWHHCGRHHKFTRQKTMQAIKVDPILYIDVISLTYLVYMVRLGMDKVKMMLGKNS